MSGLVLSRRWVLWCGACCFTVLLGCSSPPDHRLLTIDGANATTTEQSIRYIVRYLPQQQKTDFLLALVKIQVQAGQQQPAALLQGAPDMRHVNYQFIGAQTHGMTSQQVLQLAAALPQ